MRNSSADCRWLRDNSSTFVPGTQTAWTSASTATTVDLPLCRVQLSSSRGWGASSTSTCHGPGARPRLRMIPLGVGRVVWVGMGLTLLLAGLVCRVSWFARLPQPLLPLGERFKRQVQRFPLLLHQGVERILLPDRLPLRQPVAAWVVLPPAPFTQHHPLLHRPVQQAPQRRAVWRVEPRWPFQQDVLPGELLRRLLEDQANRLPVA